MFSVGDMLRTEREKCNLTLKDIEKKICVREKYLAAIENNDWSGFTSKIYIAGIIKNYARLLGLDEKKLLAFFRRDYERKEEVKFKKRVSSAYLTPETRKLSILAIVLLFAVFAGYFGYQLYLYFSPPKLTLIQPKETTINADRVEIVGQTEREAKIVIFGDRIYQNDDGVFRYRFPLKQGKNTFVVTVTGANGRKSQLIRTFIRQSGNF